MDDREKNTIKRSGSTGSASKAAASRPKSATAQAKNRTSTGRPLSTEREMPKTRNATRTTERTASRTTARTTTRPAQRRSEVQHRSGTGSKKKGSSKGGYALNPVRVIGAAVVLGLILAVVITIIMRASMLRSHQIQTDYNMGDVFDINNYFAAGSSKARLVYDDAEFVPEKLGKYTVSYKVVRGRMSKTKKGRINIVDEVSPYISGPDSIEVEKGAEIDWGDYYSVTDEDPDIQSKLKATQQIDTSEAGEVSVILTVSDWADNTSTKSITVVIN